MQAEIDTLRGIVKKLKSVTWWARLTARDLPRWWSPAEVAAIHRVFTRKGEREE
jgi:hypothetical protein